MSYYVVEPPRRERIQWVTALVAACLLLAIAMLAGWSANRPLAIKVDGKDKLVVAGTTVEDLARAGAFAAPSGDILGIHGGIAARGQGGSPVVRRNGRATTGSQRLFAGDVLTSAHGADRMESVVVTDVAIPFETRVEGYGPLTELSSLGAPGVRRVTRGEVSGYEVTSTVLRTPSTMVVMRVRPANGKLVALTFDDGPWPQSTARILNILRQEGVHATFFMLGNQAKRYPDLAKRVVAEGHTVGNHTLGHRELSAVSQAEVRRQILGGKRAIWHATGVETNLLRPPYGAMDSDAWRVVRRLNQNAVLWDVDSEDWTKPGTKKIVNGVVRAVRPGSVVLFHDGGGDRRQTAAALKYVIRKLRARGYTFVTIDEMHEARTWARSGRRPAPAAVSPSVPSTTATGSGG